jgi:hypothetical protein
MIARYPKLNAKAAHEGQGSWIRDTLPVVLPVGFQGMALVSDGGKKKAWQETPPGGCAIGTPSTWIFLVRLHPCRA